MTDLRKTIAPKSDQLNADDLIGNTRTITVSRVSLTENADQPIAINFDGDNGKPFKPCKSMRRVLVNVWGADGTIYVGRSMTLYRDDKVSFGGAEVGGIRISHVSHIDKPKTMALTASRASRKPFTVKPLEQAKDDKAAAVAKDIVDRVKSASTSEDLRAITSDAKVIEQRAWLEKKRPELATFVAQAVMTMLTELAPAEIEGEIMDPETGELTDADVPF